MLSTACSGNLMLEDLTPNNIGKNIQTSSDHKISDVKQTSLGKAGRNSTNRIENEIDDTYDIIISCLNQTILAIVIVDILLFKN
jgi:hypothetical protein